MNQTPAERDAHFMRLAIQEATRAFWRTHPNPMVGAVIVRDDAVIATGYHVAAGQPHAEVDALSKLAMQAPGAEIFITLEPCNHYGRTGPCTKALIEAGIRRCVVGVIDPDPRVSGQGIAALQAAGIVCEVGVEREACEALNAPFFTRVKAKRPFLTAKVAMTLDGRIATRTGHSRWVTGEAAREAVHVLRSQHDAVMVGTQTAALDNPALNVRLAGYTGPQPQRVVLDRSLRLPPSYQVFDTSVAPTLLVVEAGREPEATLRYPQGVLVQGVPVDAKGQLDMRALMQALAARDITTVLCEGGGELLGNLLGEGLVDRYIAFVAPTIIGGTGAPGPVGGEGAAVMQEGLKLSWERIERVGEDLMLEARVLEKTLLANTRKGR